MKIPSKLSILSAFALAASLFSSSLYSQVLLSNGTTYSQNFDNLATAAAVTADAFDFVDNVTLPGWYALSGTSSFTGSAATFTLAVVASTRSDKYSISNGSTNTGDLFSVGTLGATDRALGTLGSSSNDYFTAVRILNDTSSALSGFSVTCDGEQWRLAGNAAQRAESMYVFYRIGGTDLDNTGTWIQIPELTFTSPNIGASATGTGLDGNAASNRIAGITKSIIAAVPAGETIWIVFADADDAGSDHLLAVDNFQFTAVLSTGKDVSIGGNTTFSQNDFGGNTTFTSLDNALFDASGSTINLSGNVTANSLRFVNDGYTLAGSATDAVTVTSGSILTNPNVSATISAGVGGVNGITKTGSGTLTLSGNNTFSGTLTIVAGRVNINTESALGNASNGVSLGGTLATTGALSLGSGRVLSGSGVIETGASQSLTLGGNVSATSLTVNGATSLAFNGSSNSIGSLTLAQPAAVSVGGGALAITSGLTLGGTTTLTGPINFGSTSPTLQVNGTSFTPSGDVSTTNRIIKAGAGLLDLTSTTLTANGTNAGFRMGVQGAAPQEGGTLKIDQATDLGTATVFQFNSGTLDVTTPLSIASGISVGGRTQGVASRPTLSGSPITFTGNNSFFAATNASGDIALVVNNNTTVNGNFAATVIPTNGNQLVLPVTFIDLSGTGNLTLTGNATAVYDSFFVNGGLTLVVNGSLGSDVAQFDSGTTVSGNGTFTGYHIFPTGTGNSTVTEAYKASSVSLNSGSTLAPSGSLKFLTNLTLESGSNAVLDINGPVIGTGYDSVDVSLPGGNSTVTGYVLTTNGSLALNVAAPATTGNYTLFTTGAGVSRSGSFSLVTLTGGYSGTLAGNAATTSGNRTFAFEQSTGVLTVADSAPPVSSNANLSALSLSGASLSPSFAAGTISYTATVANSVTSLTVTPTVAQGNATVTVNGTAVASGAASGSISLSVGSNVLTTVVTAQDGVTAKSYTVTVTRSLSALESWRSSTFSGTAAAGSTATTGLGANAADFDGDGVVNLLEYATGTDATAANASPVTVSQVGSFLTLSYPVIEDSSLTYTVQGTNDLATAFTTAAGATTGTTVKTYTDTVDLSAAGARRFLRLQVTSTVTP